jgi:predicted MFS family arabinose efflux permease
MRGDVGRGGLWRDANFANLWSAATISAFGSHITGTALPFTAILLLQASPTAFGGLRIAELLPGFLIGLVAGVWVDRLRRQPIMIAADLGRALLLVTIPLAAFAGWLGFGQLYVVAALVSVLTVFFDVAHQAVLPSIVTRNDLVDANSKLSAARSVAEGIGFSAGGWLVQLLTAPVAIVVDAVTFVVSAVFVARIKDPAARSVTEPGPQPALPRSSISADIAEGLRVVWRQPVLRGLLITGIAQNLAFGLIGTVFLLYVNQEVGFAPGVLGLIFAVGGISAFLGALLASRLPRFGIGAVMIATLALAAVGEAFLPLVTAVNLAGVLLLVGQQIVTDAALTIYEINQVSLRQAIAPEDVLGRVNASARVTEVGAILAGTVAAAYLGETIGLRATLWVAVAMQLLAAGVLALSAVRRVDRIPEVETPVVALA